MRPGITGVELHVIGKALGGAYQQAVVVRGARVLVSPDIGEAIVRHGSDSSWRRSNWRLVLEVEEAGMSGISDDHRSIGVAFAE